MSAVLGMGSVPSPLVFRAVTEMPARALGIFDEVGSIEVGKRADLVIPLRILDNSDDPASGALPANPITVAPEIILHVR